jgi:hypothetical protein
VLAPDRQPDLERIGSTLDAAMFGSPGPDADERAAVDELIRTVEQDWSREHHPEDLVPSR